MLRPCSPIPSALKAAISGARLTRMHPSLLSIRMSRQIDACVGLDNAISRSFASSTSLLSSLPTSTSTNTSSTSSDRPSLKPRLDTHQTNAPLEDGFQVNFRDLGMNRITKFVVYAVICVLGTMETIFWCKVLWRWWTGEGDDDE
ncbi:hypothetical protein GGR51DRAFT_4 [Nemania sp. FL0031]|nr:hypothetical protein GGR51DRAFT_4 [Nemania sp. FL0031]